MCLVLMVALQADDSQEIFFTQLCCPVHQSKGVSWGRCSHVNTNCSVLLSVFVCVCECRESEGCDSMAVIDERQLITRREVGTVK